MPKEKFQELKGLRAISPTELAYQLGLSSATVRRLLIDGEVAGVKIGRRSWRILPGEYERLMAGARKTNTEAV